MYLKENKMTAELLSYWTNIDCTTTLGDMDPHVIVPIVRTETSK